MELEKDELHEEDTPRHRLATAAAGGKLKFDPSEFPKGGQGSISWRQFPVC